jgi:phosphate-selective porin OprO/OprP
MVLSRLRAFIVAAVALLLCGEAVAQLAYESQFPQDDAAARYGEPRQFPTLARLPQTGPPEARFDAIQAVSLDGQLTIEQRLAALEKSQADAAAKAKADAAKKPNLRINGRIHLDYWGFEKDSPGTGFFEHPTTGADPEDRFAFRRLRLNFRGDISDTMMYRFDLEFAEPQNPGYRDAWIGFRELPWFQTVLIGNQKRPLGLDHWNSSNDNVFIERPLVIEAFNEDARRLGITSYNVSEDESHTWQLGVYNLENTAQSGAYIGDSLQLSANARLSGNPWYDESSDGRGYFHWAVSGMLARPDGNASPADTNRNEGRFRTRVEARSDERWLNTGRIAGAEWYEIMGVEAMLNVGPLQIVHEYQFNWLQRQSGPDLFFQGAYVYVAYMLTGEHIPYDRSKSSIDTMKPFENFFLVNRCRGGTGGGWGAWQVAVRYSYLDLSDQDIQGGVGSNLTFALNWYWTANSKLQVNYITGQIDEHAPVGGFTSGNYSILGTRFLMFF